MLVITPAIVAGRDSRTRDLSDNIREMIVMNDVPVLKCAVLPSRRTYKPARVAEEGICRSFDAP